MRHLQAGFSSRRQKDATFCRAALPITPGQVCLQFYCVYAKITAMNRQHEAIDVEEPVSSPAAQQRLHEIRNAKHVSSLKDIGGVALFNQLRAGDITLEEHRVLADEINARRQGLTVLANAEPPHEPLHDTPVPVEEPWSPTAVLDNLPPRESLLSPQDLAAGEAVIRRDD
jgi:hypothetical protein